MAITDIIEETELTAGAPSIKYEGDMNPDQGSGIMQMASMESGQEGTLEEIYFELIADGMDPEAASIKAREIYNNMSSQPQDMMQEPRTMAADGGIMNNKKIKGQDHMLAYITPGEAKQLEKLGGQKTMTKEGIPAYPPSNDARGQSTGTRAGGGGGGGGGSNDAPADNDQESDAGQSGGYNYGPTGTMGDSGVDARENDPQFQGSGGEGSTSEGQDVSTIPNIGSRETFVEKKQDFPKYVPAWMQAAAKFNRGPNRKFFYDKVIGAGKIPGVDYTEEELEEAYKDYMDNRMAGKTDAYGNPTQGFEYGDDNSLIGNFKDSGNDQQFIPTTRDDSEEEAEEEEPFQLGLAFRADGGRVGKAYGGSMGDDGRRAYGLGSIFKKIKKVFKSPLGKAALIGLGGYGLSGGLGGTSFMQGLKSQGLSGILKKAGGYALKNPGTIIPLASAAGALFTEEDEEEDKYVDNTGFDPDEVRENYLKYLPRANRAEGGPMGGEIMEGESEELLDMNGMEKDYREDGGFVPIGEYEKKDDVPARLSKNEFVFTADAVRGAGEGDVDLGAEKLYTQMKELESVGKRMQGANEMFQTSQRLEEVV
jgi:hypothetical protein